MPVSIWSNIVDGEYADRILAETANNLVVKYFGQRSGAQDHLVIVGAHFFYKNGIKSKYKYAGLVTSVVKTGVENNINVYELVIARELPEREFRVKNDACDAFGWTRLNSFAVMSGIIAHYQA